MKSMKEIEVNGFTLKRIDICLFACGDCDLGPRDNNTEEQELELVRTCASAPNCGSYSAYKIVGMTELEPWGKK
jgi:hypothetical protein